MSVWAEHRDWHPNDAKLRRFGWHVVARPPGQESVWQRGKVKLKESLALALCEQELKRVEKAGK